MRTMLGEWRLRGCAASRCGPQPRSGTMPRVTNERRTGHLLHGRDLSDRWPRPLPISPRVRRGDPSRRSRRCTAASRRRRANEPPRPTSRAQAASRPGTGHGLDSRRRVLDGQRRRDRLALRGCRHHARRAADSSRRRRRLLDGRDRGHERAVRGLRRGDRLRDDRRASARPAGTSRARRRTLLVPGSAVFTPPDAPVDLRNPLQWWRYVPGATWRHPDGPGSRICADANASRSCTSRTPMRRRTPRGPAGGCRPKRSGSSPRAAGRGQPLRVGQRPHARTASHHANIHQGAFPHRDDAADGFAGVAPVGALRAECIRPPRHGRQRLGMDERLVSARLLRHARRVGPCRGQSPRPRQLARSGRARRGQEGAARRIVPLHRAGPAPAIWSARAARERSRPAAITWASVRCGRGESLPPTATFVCALRARRHRAAERTEGTGLAFNTGPLRHGARTEATS